MIFPSHDDLEDFEAVRPMVDKDPNLNGKYLVSNFGRVWSLHYGKWLKPETNPKGYLKIKFWYGDPSRGKGVVIRRARYVHRIVMIAFAGLPDFNDPTVDHLNRDKTNNRIDNLEWVTRSENGRRAHL